MSQATASTKPVESTLGVICALFLITAYPLLSTLFHQSYPLASLEVALLIGMAALIAMILGLLLSRIRPAVRHVVLALWIALSLTLQFNLLLVGLLMVVIASLIGAWLLGRHLSLMAIAIFSALIIGALLDSHRDRQAQASPPVAEHRNQDLPPVLHLILDGFIGIDGLPPQAPAQQFRTELVSFLERYALSAYPRAYSRYFASEDSLSRAFNQQRDAENIFQRSLLMQEGLQVENNRYLDQLAAQGYRLRIYQSEAFALCQPEQAGIDHCWSYRNPHLRSLAEGLDQPLDRAKVILKVLLARSSLLDDLGRRLGLESTWGVATYDAAVIDEILSDMQAGAEGQVFLAHLMVPHPPFVLDADCRLDYSIEPPLRFSFSVGPQANNYESRGLRYLLYLDQARCVLKELGRLFDGLEAAGVLERSIVILHGDHGSRILLHQPFLVHAQQLTPSDLLDAYSTLFAVRYPGDSIQSPGLGADPETPTSRSLDSLIGEHLARITQTPINLDDPPFVYLSGSFPLTRLPVDIFAELDLNRRHPEEQQ